MALFSRNKEQAEGADATAVAEEKKTPAPKKPVVSKALPTDRNLASVLIKPRITEKAVGQSGNNVYVFIIRPDATKRDVKDAVKQLYNVTPVKVNIVKKAPRQFMSRGRGRKITEKGMKKAYVYLKQGDSINLV